MAKKCKATMESKSMPGHIHVCGREHDDADHQCEDKKCRRYFWKKGTLV